MSWRKFIKPYLKVAVTRLLMVRSNIYYKAHSRKFNSILRQYKESNACKGIIVYKPFLRWNFLFQRIHNLAMHLSSRGYLFFYCSEDIRDNINGFKQLKENLFLTSRFDILSETLKDAWFIFTAIDDFEINTLKAIKQRGNRIIYDYSDEIHLHFSPNFWKTRYRHKQIKNTDVNLVLTSAKSLTNEIKDRVSEDKILFIPNAVEYEHFHIERNYNDIPKDIRALVAQNKPIIGFHGAIEKWIDVDLIKYILDRRPEWNLLLVGPLDNEEAIELTKQRRSNLFCVGKKDYKILPKYSCWFDVAMLPFKEGGVAKSTSPKKMYEFFALNKPVVITKDLEECKEYNGVLVAENAEDFIEKIELALKLKDDVSFVQKIDQDARKNRWQFRIQLIDEFISRCSEIMEVG